MIEWPPALASTEEIVGWHALQWLDRRLVWSVARMAEIEHPHLAVMFTDIKGYSRMMSVNWAWMGETRNPTLSPVATNKTAGRNVLALRMRLPFSTI